MSTFERFVLIDDNEADNVYHEIMIRRAGFTGEVLVFENGIDALAFFASDPMDGADLHLSRHQHAHDGRL